MDNNIWDVIAIVIAIILAVVLIFVVTPMIASSNEAPKADIYYESMSEIYNEVSE